MEVRTVIDPYVMRKKPRTAKWKANDVRLLKEKIYAAHSYYFRPQEDEEKKTERQARPSRHQPHRRRIRRRLRWREKMS